MRHLRLGRRVLIPRNGLHNRINVGHGRLEVPRASHSTYKEWGAVARAVKRRGYQCAQDGIEERGTEKGASLHL